MKKLTLIIGSLAIGVVTKITDSVAMEMDGYRPPRMPFSPQLQTLTIKFTFINRGQITEEYKEAGIHLRAMFGYDEAWRIGTRKEY